MGIGSKLKDFWENSKRIINISYKPTNDEFRKAAKIVLLGILLIGISGFIIGAILYFITTGTLI
jgi:protein transport protein SEC61 subunit gamma and related proteins